MSLTNPTVSYLEDLRKYLAQLKESKGEAQGKKERKRENKEILEKRKHLKVLVKYLDKDYAHVKKRSAALMTNLLGDLANPLAACTPCSRMASSRTIFFGPFGSQTRWSTPLPTARTTNPAYSRSRWQRSIPV